MAANPYLTSEWMSSLRYRGFSPSNPATSSNAELLRLATEEMRTYVLALLKSVREEYGIYSTDVTLTAGTTTYNIPTRASGQSLRHVAYVDATGGEVPLDAVDPANRSEYATGQNTGEPTCYIVQGNQLIVLPTPNSGYTLRLKYLARPNRLVYPTAVGEITAINTGTGAVTLQIPEYVDLNGATVAVSATAPSTFTSSATYDFVRGTPGFESLAIDQAASVASNVLTFASLPTGLAVGDFVCLAGESPIPQIPVECHDLLAERCAYLEATVTSNSKKAQMLALRLKEKHDAVRDLISPRLSSASTTLVYRYGPGCE